MVIVSCLEVMGIFSACRVYFKYFLTKINMSMCFGMLLRIKDNSDLGQFGPWSIRT